MDLAGSDEIGQSQDGLIARRQSLEFLSHKQIDRRIASGHYTPMHRRVFRMNGAPRTWRQRARAAVLARDGSLASHRTAACLWGMLERAPRTIEILVPMTGSARLPNATVHRTRNWHTGMVRDIDGIPVTSPARTIIDLSAACSKRTLGKVIDRAITSRIVTLDDIANELQVIGSRGRARCRLLYSVLAVRDKTFEKTEEISEVDVLEWIKEAGLPEPVPQRRIILGPDDVARPDLCYPDRKLAIEIVSWRWHGGPSAFERDNRRVLKLQAAGWQVVPITRKTPRSEALQAIRLALDARPPP